MNIYEKMQLMKVELQQKNIKKSGKNKFAGYSYYELGDILPPINEILAKYKACGFISFNKEEATLTIINSENIEEKIEFTSPMAGLTLKGAHEIQNLGGIETYQRRYLYMAAFEIVENDYFDAVQGRDQVSNNKPSLNNDLKNKINKQILRYSELLQKPVPEVTKELGKLAKKDLKLINDDEANMILSVLNTKISNIEEKNYVE